MKLRTTFIYAILPFYSISLSAQSENSLAKSTVTIDMNKTIGTIRPLHGGNLGPVSDLKILDLSDYFKECKVPLVRLHDAPWFTSYSVDITTIFKNFSADPSNPDSYDFRKTDDYIASIVATGSNILYRLGESIEWSKKRYNVNPPTDFNKWAKICSGIIKHYNEGWAKGYHYNIKYWEIWNEPDHGTGCWTGTRAQFFDLYETTAKALKHEFPNVKIGGPAMAIPLNIKGDSIVPADFTTAFLSHCQQKAIPLDFFSWHNYNSSPWELSQLPTSIRKVLNQYGFSGTESILDEWNYAPPGFNFVEQGKTREQSLQNQSSLKGATFLASVLMLMQDRPIDAMNFYSTTGGMFGLFSDYGELHKTAFTFKAFSILANQTPIRIETNYNKTDSLIFCTGTNKEKSEIQILISNFSSTSREVDFNINNSFLKDTIVYEVYAVDERHNLEKLKAINIQSKNTMYISENIKGPSVLLLKLISK